MKIISNRKKLLEAVKIASKAASNSVNRPELKHILIEADVSSCELKLTCTNTEVTIRKILSDTKILREGRVLLPAQLFCDMLKLLDGEDVSLELGTNQSVTIQCNQSIYTIMSLGTENFPNADICFPQTTVMIRGLSALIKKSMFAAMPNSDNLSCQGSYISFSAMRTFVATTDKYRLSGASSDCCADNDLNVFIHQRVLNLLCSVIRPADTFFAGVADNQFVLFNKDMIFCSRLTEIKYPDVEKLINAVQKSYGALVPAKDLYHAFDIIKSSGTNIGKFVIENESITLSSESEKGKFKQLIQAQNTIPSAKPFCYSIKQMLDFLNVVTGDVEVIIADNGKILLYAENCKYLVMPYRDLVAERNNKTTHVSADAA